MPNIKSAKKRHRQSLQRRARNRATKSALRTQIRKVKELIAAGNVDEARKESSVLSKKLDQAAAKRVLHSNTSARLKSRMSKRLKAAQQSATASA
jgi:small subunit ribosomal protein S20